MGPLSNFFLVRLYQISRGICKAVGEFGAYMKVLVLYGYNSFGLNIIDLKMCIICTIQSGEYVSAVLQSAVYTFPVLFMRVAKLKQELRKKKRGRKN